MTTKKTDDTEGNLLHCSFCGKNQNEVKNTDLLKELVEKARANAKLKKNKKNWLGWKY